MERNPAAMPKMHSKRSTSLAIGVLAAGGLAACLFFSGLSNHDFWLTDEPFVAEIGREMLASGDWVVPRLNGEAFLEKPPLHYAQIALSFKAFGQTPFAARLPSALAGLLTVCATYLLGWRLLGRRIALGGALLLPTVYLFFYSSHYALVDASLVLFVTAGFAALAYALEQDSAPWALPAAYAAAALAFLAKGPVGPLFLALGAGSFALAERDWTFFRPRRHILGAALFSLLIAPWLVALWSNGGWTYYRAAFLDNTLGRAFALPAMVPGHDSPLAHQAPFYDYLGGLLGGFLPWTPLLLIGLAPAFSDIWRRLRGGGEGARGCRGARFLAVSFAAGFLLLSLVRTKRSIYLEPLYPLLALLVAWGVERCLRDRAIRDRWKSMLALQVAVLGLFSMAVPSGYLYLAGPMEGEWPATEAILLGGALMLVAMAATAWSVRLLVLDRLDRLVNLLWVQAAAGFLAMAVLCFPLLEAQKSFAPFFRRACSIESARGRCPVLLLNNESYTGLAALNFHAVLPTYDASLGGEADVITEAASLGELGRAPRRSLTMLASQSIGGPGTERALFLVHVDAPGPPMIQLKLASAAGPPPKP